MKGKGREIKNALISEASAETKKKHDFERGTLRLA